MSNNPIKTRLCPNSNTFFIAKRQNQIFRSKFDRISWHNDQNNALRKKLSFINKGLLKNYKITDELLGDLFDVKANKHFLRGRGFSFKLFTHFEMEDDIILYGLYNITFQRLNEEEYLIKRTR
jgi:hypothetical protein